MNTTSTAVVKLSIEVNTLPVGDVERALWFYVDQVGFTVDVNYSPNVQLTPPAPAARSRSVADSPMRPSDDFATSISSSPTSRLRGTAYSTVGSQSVRSGTRYPLMPGTEVSHPGSTPHAWTTPASPTSRTRMATAGCRRNAATAIRDVAP